MAHNKYGILTESIILYNLNMRVGETDVGIDSIMSNSPCP